MIGTWVNLATVLVGGFLGLLLGNKIPERLRKTVIAGLGLFTIGLGLQFFLKTEQPLIPLGSLLVGGLLGEWWKIEEGLQWLGAWLERRFSPQHGNEEQQKFIRGFLTASLVFCVGPMAIMGSIQDGLNGEYQTLVVKAVLDGFAALAFASSLGIGVLFSGLTVLIYQGAITLLAAQLDAIVTPMMMNEMTAVGGLILIGIAISSLLELKPIRTASFLPALLLAPLAAALLDLIGVL
ncbi:MAG TPA: DUF554 domain-containing protein [Longilinea sp.]|nr:DUF554 domain-containing protein [Longilinea sp.]